KDVITMKWGRGRGLKFRFLEDFDWKDEFGFWKLFGDDFDWRSPPVFLPIFAENFSGWP
ncbi:unnamed protein product, partial [marine sediment metagenome]